MNPDTLTYIATDGTATVLPRDEAMRAYAAAGFTGRLVAPTPVVAPVVEAAPAAVPALRAGVDIEPEAAKRIAAQEQWLKAKGFAAAGTWFAAGTEMLESGRAKYASLAKRHADLPVFRDAAREVARRITGEQRQDVRVGDAALLRLDGEGRITRGRSPLRLEAAALRSLVQRFPKAFPSAWQFLALMDVEARRDAVNAQLGRLAEFYPEESERDVRLRIRNLDGEWQAFATVSPSYLPMDGNRVLAAYVEALDGLRLPDPRGVVAYNPETTDLSIRATWHAPQSLRPAVGDVFETGLSARSNDAGTGSHRAGNTFTRIVCINCTIAEFGDDLRRVHRGSRSADNTAQGLERVKLDVAQVVGRTDEAARFFLSSWGTLRDTPVSAMRLGGKVHTSGLSAAKALVSSGDFDADVPREQLTRAVESAFEAEPGDSMADVVNAFTRAAHEGLLDDIARWRVERAAGQLVPVLASRASE
jgi:hypothetical protein